MIRRWADVDIIEAGLRLPERCEFCIGTPPTSWKSHIYACLCKFFSRIWHFCSFWELHKKSRTRPLRPGDAVEADSADGSARVGLVELHRLRDGTPSR